jgi:hypothetical protein
LGDASASGFHGNLVFKSAALAGLAHLPRVSKKKKKRKKKAGKTNIS